VRSLGRDLNSRPTAFFALYTRPLL